ncbi:MAG: peroxiredoxin [Caulobacterales bacterium]
MKRVLGAFAALAVLATPALAALKPGAKAPMFSAPAAKAGEEFNFSLAEALQKGPVVLYFYPAAFTKGCTIEAHMFAEASDEFAALGATVIGVSRDSVKKLKEFSVSECRNKFAVASADPGIIKAYDVAFKLAPNLADRVSFVIAQDGTIAYEYSALDPSKHVENTLAAVKKLHKK